MKAFKIFIIVVVIAGILFIVTKPSDEVCKKAAMDYVNANAVKVPGYSDPSDADTRNAVNNTGAENVIIKDRILWKEVKYIYLSEVRSIGYGYLGKFHYSNQKKAG